MTKKSLVLLVLLGLLATPGFAVSKEILQLQQQVALLMAQVKDLQQAVATDIGALKSLVGQNTDSLAKLQRSVNGLKQTLDTQAALSGQNQNQLGQNFQNINDAITDLQARLNKVNETLTQIQQAQQTLPAPGTQPAQNGTAIAPNGVPGGASAGSTPGAISNGTVPSPVNGAATGTGTTSVAASSQSPALPPAQLYKNALLDYVNGAYPLAQNEFQTFIGSYPDDGNAAQASYYLGDIFMKEQKYKQAIDVFNGLLNSAPAGSMAAGAQLKKGYALIALRERAAGIREFRSLISHYPDSQEAKQAKSELAALGVSARP